MIKPRALKTGDTIGIVAPASPTEDDKVIKAQRALEEKGFRVKLGQSCFSRLGYLSGHDDVRAGDINNMFMDDTVDGIICLRGGYGSIRILDKLYYRSVRANPKVFIGYSDITALHIALNQICELVTFHGPMAASDFANGLDDFSWQSFNASISNPEKIGHVKNPENRQMEGFVRGEAEGKIVGGNLSIVVSTLGTPYEIDTKNKILLLEDIQEPPYSIDRMLSQLVLSKKLKSCSGIILGDFNNCEAQDNKNSLGLREVFEDILKPLHIPTIINAAAGHCDPKITLPLGVEAVLDGSKGELYIKEGGVS